MRGGARRSIIRVRAVFRGMEGVFLRVGTRGEDFFPRIGANFRGGGNECAWSGD